MPPEEEEQSEQEEQHEEAKPDFSGELGKLREDNATLREQLAEMRGALDSIRSQPPQQIIHPAQPGEPAITDDEIDEAISEGKGAARKVRSIIEQAVKRETGRLKADEIDPLRNAGMASLRELAATTIRNLDYYEDYKGEIDAVAKQVPTENLGNPQTWLLIYNNVVGSHVKDIAKKEAEAALRRGREAGEGSLPGGAAGPRTTAESPKPPEPRDIGEGVDFALKLKKSDPDSEARRMGYKDWASYEEMGRRLEEEHG